MANKFLGMTGLGVIVDKIKEVIAQLALKVDPSSLPIYDATTSTNLIISGIEVAAYGPCLIKGFRINRGSATYIVDKDSYVPYLGAGIGKELVLGIGGKYSDLEQGSTFKALIPDRSMVYAMTYVSISATKFVDCEQAVFLNECLKNSGICDDFVYDENTTEPEFYDFLHNTNLKNNSNDTIWSYLHTDINLIYILTKYAPHSSGSAEVDEITADEVAAKFNS